MKTDQDADKNCIQLGLACMLSESGENKHPFQFDLASRPAVVEEPLFLNQASAAGAQTDWGDGEFNLLTIDADNQAAAPLFSIPDQIPFDQDNFILSLSGVFVPVQPTARKDAR